jgi:peroxiredoxin
VPRRLLLPLVAVALGALLAVGLLVRPGSPAGAQPAPRVGHAAPDFTLSSTSGRILSLSQYRGHVVLINFFATWCIPCRTEMPLINQRYLAHGRRFVVLAVDKQEPTSDVLAFVRSHRLSFTPVIDPDAGLWQTYQLGSLQPVSFWIDRSGVVRSIHYGPMDKPYIERELRALKVA